MEEQSARLTKRVAELEAELAARDTQLRQARERYEELRHRIRNNLQELLILPTLRAGHVNMPDGCQRCLLRLSGVAEFHRLLDENGTTQISMASYLPALSATLTPIVGDRITIQTTVEDNPY